ncbi:uncharacterized protein LOC110675577 isoform X2 [Aedes aegypti]|uniref:Uncharacterized protein n=1 Tax=Aedes aegypti TaxID=7159 RepID=A0A6I8TXE4_AEDAE|nr:uncharacterized protein LOC110675577 isoform X2 [Aedes aegypti]
MAPAKREVIQNNRKFCTLCRFTSWRKATLILDNRGGGTDAPFKLVGLSCCEKPNDINSKLDYRVSKRVISDVLGIYREEISKMKDDSRRLQERNDKVDQSKNEAHGYIRDSVVDLLMECLKDLVLDKLENHRC